MLTAATPVLAERGLAFAEGINFDRDGTLYCVDWIGGGIWRRPPDGPLHEWIRTGGNPNGSRFGPGGDLFVAECGCRAILRLSTTTGHVTIYANRCDGEPLLGPNDLCFAPDGTLYFTDPGTSSLGDRYGTVRAVTPDGTVTRIAEGLAMPNGIAVAPDGVTLIVAETYTGLLRRYSLEAGSRYEELVPLTILTPARGPGADGRNDAGPDGMTLGADGNLYVAHAGSGFVQVISPAGTIIAHLAAGGPGPTNVAFWRNSLYVTEGWSGAIYRLDIDVREHPPFMRPW